MDLEHRRKRAPHDDGAPGGDEIHEIFFDEPLAQVKSDPFEAAQDGKFVMPCFVREAEQGDFAAKRIILPVLSAIVFSGFPHSEVVQGFASGGDGAVDVGVGMRRR